MVDLCPAIRVGRQQDQTSEILTALKGRNFRGGFVARPGIGRNCLLSFPGVGC